MFEVLLASDRRARGRMQPGLVAAAIHVGVLAFAITGRTVLPAAARTPHLDSILLFAPPAPPTPAASTSAAGVIPQQPRLPTMAPIALPPALDLPANWTPKSLPDPRSTIDLPAGWPHGFGDPVQSPGAAMQTLLAGEVDEPIVMLRPGRLNYPPALEAAGIPGRVVLEFVVDRTGSIEAGSLTVISSTHVGFEEPARQAVLASRFRAARLGGVAVRQLARQAMAFRALR